MSHQLETIIGYKFKNPKLLETALTHTSYANESRTPCDTLACISNSCFNSIKIPLLLLVICFLGKFSFSEQAAKQYHPAP